MPDQGQQVARVLYKELLVGDLRKFKAQSNDAKSGGGARDIRFRQYNELLPIIRKIFPEVEVQRRRRSGFTDLEIHKGVFHWMDPETSQVHTRESFFEPPSDARPKEGRIARVHEYACFRAAGVPALDAEDRILLLFVQNMNGSVWPCFAQESSLRTPNTWDPSIAKELLESLDAKRPKRSAAFGYYDFTDGSRYRNGK